MTSRTAAPARRSRSARPAASWAELAAAGYERFTYEAVAARAGTSRPVLYRRWPAKRDLVLAALRHRAPALPDAPPDTGSLRGDVLALLRLVVRRTRDLAPVHRVLAAEGPGTELSAYLAARDRGPGADWMRTVLERAAARGEIGAPGSLPDRVVTLPVVLVVHELFLAHRTPSEGDLEEIVDRLFLPLAGLRGRREG
ncbi:TetR/AcrR family transcriptional regulator [Streptomyces caatingaensis]|uniref:TetR family transcriptional regulator n=1 Tax=Streptomyces caatingaensis TaxID=1678637 RepID=A0A0K9XBT0_9ACTN|nr:TetR/AcrR family transcriptional regulator [Streptomyces caatingaensis]KNB50566.1 TetR family transcriptional regulator [Streptomyces caatingaensis]